MWEILVMWCLYSHDILLHYRRVWCWQELSAVCDDPVPSESVWSEWKLHPRAALPLEDSHFIHHKCCRWQSPHGVSSVRALSLSLSCWKWLHMYYKLPLYHYFCCRLQDIGFEDFVRVGSMKKIAKPVLPYRLVSI